jgi:hypothetical protein
MDQSRLELKEKKNHVIWLENLVSYMVGFFMVDETRNVADAQDVLQRVDGLGVKQTSSYSIHPDEVVGIASGCGGAS